MKNFFEKKKLSILSVLLVTCLFSAGCGFGLGQDSAAPTIVEPSQMPDIVFVEYLSRADSPDDGGPLSEITFLDKEGNFYTSDDFSVCGLTFAALVADFAAGKIDDKITRLEKTVPVEDIFERYQIICEISVHKDYALETPGTMPAILSDRMTWYGLYYDQTGALQSIKLHENRQMTDISANDERANEIYAWFDGLVA